MHRIDAPVFGCDFHCVFAGVACFSSINLAASFRSLLQLSIAIPASLAPSKLGIECIVTYNHGRSVISSRSDTDRAVSFFEVLNARVRGDARMMNERQPAHGVPDPKCS